jgi:hypothetical protein
MSVMPGLVPGIHVLLSFEANTWMAGTSPAMTRETILHARSRFGLTVPVFLRAFCGPDSALDKIYFN